MNLAFDTDIREDALFVTGNAPLVDVLSKALEYSYKGKTSSRSMKIPTGYAHEKGTEHSSEQAPKVSLPRQMPSTSSLGVDLMGLVVGE